MGPASIPSITGGAATSGNGDSAFSADGTQQGGLTYNKGKGIDPMLLIGAALLGVFLYVSRKAK